MKTAKELLVGMLTENTGTHFLDSGGENGRMWQRNAGKDFEAEQPVTLEGDTLTVSIYHYLSELLEVDEISTKINKNIAKHNRKNPNEQLYWVQDVIDWLEGDTDKIVRDYIEGKNRLYQAIENIKDPVNSYNYDSNFSQVILYSTFTKEGEAYVVLQIHGGADVRGGYTDPKVFKVTGYIGATCDVYGTIDGVQVDNMYNGYSLTDQDGNEIDLDNVTDYSLEMNVSDETYLYTE